MRLSCSTLKIWQVIHRKRLILTYPTCVWRPHRGLSCSNCAVTFGTRKIDSLAYHVVSLHNRGLVWLTLGNIIIIIIIFYPR